MLNLKANEVKIGDQIHFVYEQRLLSGRVLDLYWEQNQLKIKILLPDRQVLDTHFYNVERL